MEPSIERKLTTILSADVAGYSRLMGQDEPGTLATLRTYRAAMGSLIERHRGRVVGTSGDHVLAEFASVVKAVECAVQVQRELAERNAGLPEDRHMRFRIGINLGDVMVEKADLYGDGVNIAARLQALADPGGILISGTVFDHVRDKLTIGFDYLGEKAVKNIAGPLPVYRVLLQPGAAAAPGREDAAPADTATGPAAPVSAAGQRARRLHRLYVSAARCGTVIAGLLAINLLTWDGDPWSVWPILAILVFFCLRATSILRPPRTGKA